MTDMFSCDIVVGNGPACCAKDSDSLVNMLRHLVYMKLSTSNGILQGLVYPPPKNKKL